MATIKLSISSIKMALPSKIPSLSPSDDIQNPKTGWRSTIAFRNFRRKHNELSKMHWTSLLGSHYISIENNAIQPGQKLTLVGQGIPFGGHMMPLTQQEMADWLPEYESAIRNSIVLFCSGNLELYLKRSIRFYLLAEGYSDQAINFKLNNVGEAIGFPVLNRSTIHAQLRYIESLIGINFNKHLTVWEKAYKERCNHAHQAGVVTNSKDGDMQFYGENIHTDWPALKQLLDSTNQIVGIIDQKISTSSMRNIELEFELEQLKTANKLPLKSALWTYCHQNLGVDNPGAADKERIEKWLY